MPGQWIPAMCKGVRVMDLVTAEQMRQLDRKTIEGLSIPAVALMENAGRAIAEEVIALCHSRHGGGAGGEDRNGGRAGAGGGCADADIAGRGGYINAGPGAENGRDEGANVGRGSGGPGIQPPGFRVSGDAALTWTLPKPSTG